jgi:hypothetical protein
MQNSHNYPVDITLLNRTIHTDRDSAIKALTILLERTTKPEVKTRIETVLDGLQDDKLRVIFDDGRHNNDRLPTNLSKHKRFLIVYELRSNIEDKVSNCKEQTLDYLYNYFNIMESYETFEEAQEKAKAMAQKFYKIDIDLHVYTDEEIFIIDSRTLGLSQDQTRIYESGIVKPD